MVSSEVWGVEAAARYDDPDSPMFSPEVLGPTVDLLAALADGGPVLEFAIGTGRVAAPLADRGVAVTGIELSAPMIAQLRGKADDDRIPVVLGDMATARAPGAGEFALVYLVFNTISNLLTQDEQVECFANAARHLRPGGHFLVELGLPDLRRLPPGQHAVPFEVSERHLGFDTYELVEQRLTSHHVNPDRDGAHRRTRSRHRYAWPAEMDLMARMAGMRLVRRVADWDGSPYTDDSRATISVWQRE